MTQPEKSKDLCQGCRDDFYNRVSVRGCWMFENAKLTQLQRVGIWESPPYKWNPEWRLACYHTEGYVMLPETDSRIVKES